MIKKLLRSFKRFKQSIHVSSENVSGYSISQIQSGCSNSSQKITIDTNGRHGLGDNIQVHSNGETIIKVVNGKVEITKKDK